MTMSENDVFRMLTADDKLDGNNYPLWAYMMCHVLVSKGFWNIVQGFDVYVQDLWILVLLRM